MRDLSYDLCDNKDPEDAQNLSTLNDVSRDSSRFFHKFDLIVYSRYLSEITTTEHQRKPTQK